MLCKSWHNILSKYYIRVKAPSFQYAAVLCPVLFQQISVKEKSLVVSFWCFPTDEKDKRTWLHLIQYIKWMQKKFGLLWMGAKVS